MVIFSIICLVLVLIGIQHLYNFLIRRMWNYPNESEESTLVLLTLIMSIANIAISYFVVIHIIKWGQPLIKLL